MYTFNPFTRKPDYYGAGPHSIEFQGSIDASSSPDYPEATLGDTYVISVSGTIGGPLGPSVDSGDMIYCIAASSPEGDHAAVGDNWNITQGNVIFETDDNSLSDMGTKSIGTTGRVVQSDHIHPSSTSDDSFQIDSGSSGPRIKNNSNVLEVRNSTDDDYVPITVESIRTESGDNYFGGLVLLGSTISGSTPTESYHLTTKSYVDTISGAVSSQIITDHGNLTGLTDDDHNQYVPTDGSRGFTSTVSGVEPTESYHLTTKDYVDATTLSHGVEWDEDDSSPTLTRLGSLAYFSTGSSPGDSQLPIHSEMKRCILNDSGEVEYYLDPNDSTKKAGGTTANLDGTDGQVMVEIPKFYYKYGYDATTNKHQWWVSPVDLPGYDLHPAFLKNGSEVDYRYIGAYEGSMYDASAGTMTPSGSIATNMYAAGDKLCSISGEFPKTNETRDEFRSMAAERGTGWRQQDYDLVSAIQLLYIVEYATWDSQTAIGEGRTAMFGGSWAADSYIGQCGKSNGDGNGTNSVGGNTNDAYMTYRGIENFFGNIWKWVDGFNIISDNIPYVTNNDSDFADNTTTGYTRLEDINGDGITLPSSSEYQITLEQINRGFLPASVGAGGSDSTYICDYYYSNTGDRVAVLGGAATYGGLAGFFYWSLDGDSSTDGVYIGARVCF